MLRLCSRSQNLGVHKGSRSKSVRGISAKENLCRVFSVRQVNTDSKKQRSGVLNYKYAKVKC